LKTYSSQSIINNHAGDSTKIKDKNKESSRLLDLKKFIVDYPKNANYKNFRCGTKVLTIALKLLETEEIDTLLNLIPGSSLDLPLTYLKLVKYSLKFFKGMSTLAMSHSSKTEKKGQKKVEDASSTDLMTSKKKDLATKAEDQKLGALKKIVLANSDARRNASKYLYSAICIVAMPILFYSTYTQLNTKADANSSQALLLATFMASAASKSLQDARRLSIVQSAAEKWINTSYANAQDEKVKFKAAKRHYFYEKAVCNLSKEVFKHYRFNVVQNMIKVISAIITVNKPVGNKEKKQKIKEKEKELKPIKNMRQQHYLNAVRVMIFALIILNVMRVFSQENSSF
jgi:hypothetical protein